MKDWQDTYERTEVTSLNKEKQIDLLMQKLDVLSSPL